MSFANSTFMSVVSENWIIFLLFFLLIVGALVYILVGDPKTKKSLGYQNYKKEGFEQFGQPNYALAIGIPVGIIVALGAFTVVSRLVKR